MVNMTLAVPEDLHRVMRRHPEIRWSEVARRGLREYAERIEFLDRLTSGSELKEGDVERISHRIKEAIVRHYGKPPS